VSKWPYLQILAYAMYTWLKWFETINKLNLTLNEPKTMTFGQRKSKQNKIKWKTLVTYDNGQMWQI
jgi:hypothetical protein